MAAPWIQVLNGNCFDYRNIKAEDIHAVDIAFSLGRKCRYNGYTKAHYSVAEHCIHLARLAMDQGSGIHMALAALLHDATEAYMADFPGPLKDMPEMQKVRDMETEIVHAVIERFDLRDPLYPHERLHDDWPEWVKTHDLLILHDEALQVFDAPPREDWHLKYKPGCNVQVGFYSQEKAQVMYFQMLTDLLEMRIKETAR